MGAQDNTEKVLRSLHVLLSKSEPYPKEPSKVISFQYTIFSTVITNKVLRTSFIQFFQYVLTFCFSCLKISRSFSAKNIVKNDYHLLRLTAYCVACLISIIIHQASSVKVKFCSALSFFLCCMLVIYCSHIE